MKLLGVTMSVWLLVTAIFIGLGLRLLLLVEPLWIDELHTAWTIDAGLKDVANRAGQGNQTPLYFWICFIVCQLMGTTELTLRLPSLVCSVATIALATRFVVRVSQNRNAAGLTAALLSIDAWLIYYAAEARPYALLQLLSVLQVMAFVRAVGGHQSADLKHKLPAKLVEGPLLITSTLVLLTHLTAVALIVTEIMLVAVFFRAADKRRLLLPLAIPLLTLIPQLSVIRAAVSHRNDWESFSNLRELVLQLSYPMLCYVVAPLACLLLRRTFTPPTVRRSENGWIAYTCLAWGFVPILAIVVLSGLDWVPLASYRYTIIGSIGLPVFTGLIVSRIDRQQIQFGCILFIAICAVATNPIALHFAQHRTLPSHRHEDWKAVAERIQYDAFENNLPIFLFGNLVEDRRLAEFRDDKLESYLCFPLSGIYALPPPLWINPMPTMTSGRRWTADDVAHIRRSGGGVVVARVRPDDFRSILDELRRVAEGEDVPMQIQINTHRGNLILLARLKTTTRP